MPSLYLTTPGSKARLSSQHLEVEIPTESEEQPLVRKIPLHEIEQVIVEVSTSLTISALAAFAERSVPVVVVVPNGQAVALCLPPSGDAPTRIAQYQSRFQGDLLLGIARALVEAKIANCRRLLQRLAANRTQDAPPAVARLESFRRGALDAASVDSCRGLEGSAAGTYFEGLAPFFPSQCPFERRSRRPPLNPPNSLLSFGYSLLTNETTTVLHACGFDPGVGYLHEPESARASLALDLIEPFRAPVADGLALDLLNHGTLQPRPHFEEKNGGVYLNAEGRRRYFTAYERRMDRPFTSDLTGERTTLRDEIRRQALSLKRLLRGEGPLEPYIMN